MVVSTATPAGAEAWAWNWAQTWCRSINTCVECADSIERKLSRRRGTTFTL